MSDPTTILTDAGREVPCDKACDTMADLAAELTTAKATIKRLTAERNAACRWVGVLGDRTAGEVLNAIESGAFKLSTEGVLP